MKRLIYLVFAFLIITSCGSTTHTITRGNQYAAMYEEKPATLLVMPPINCTDNADAKELLYFSMNRPLLEAGYYVIPPQIAMDILKAEKGYDSENFIEEPLDGLRMRFGVDAVVFTIIEKWAKIGFCIDTKIRYIIRSAHTNEILFERSCDMYVDLHDNSKPDTLLGMMLDVTSSAITTAITDHIIAARYANYIIINDIPRGKYNPDHMIDKDEPAEPKDVRRYTKD